MLFPQHIFRAYDIRGLIAEITPTLAEAVARALVAKTGAKTVVVGRDMRETSPQLALAATEALTSLGVNVLDIGMCTTPLFYYAVVGLYGANAGIMITASHNPAEYNGIKITLGDGSPITGSDMYKIIEESPVPSVPPALRSSTLSESEGKSIGGSVQGSVKSVAVLEDYLQACMRWPGIESLHGIKIVVDYGNGMGAVAFKPLCEKLGIKCVELYAEPDAHFPNHEANPAKTETLDVLRAKVLEVNADFGVAFDGDADRIGFVDNEGVPLTGDMALAVMATEYLRQHGSGKVLVCVNQSRAVNDAIETHGGEVIWSPVGRTKISALMKKENAVLAGEFSSHFFFPEFHFLEATEHAFVRIATTWKKSGQSFADLVRPYRRYAQSEEMNLEIHQKQEAIDALKEKYASQATTVMTIDGVRCEFDRDWWFLIRASNTEPILRVTIEAKDEALLQEKKEEILSLLQTFA